MANFFLQHSSASLTINENYDPDVRRDMEMMLNRIAPENAPYIHTMEGSDDMPAHVKSSVFGNSLNIQNNNSKLALGTWQGKKEKKKKKKIIKIYNFCITLKSLLIILMKNFIILLYNI